MTRTVRDAAIMLRSDGRLRPEGFDQRRHGVPDFEAALTGDIRGLKVGIPKEYRVDGMPAEIERVWQQGADWLRAAGAEIVEVSLPHTKYALPTYYIVAPAEASSNLARYDGVRYGLRKPGRSVIDMYENTRAEGFGAEVRRRVMIGTYVLSAGYYDAYYLRAQKVRTLIKKDFEDCFAKGVTAILTPATPSAAFGIGEKGGADPIEMYLNDIFTVTVNMAGLPGIAVPAGLDHKGLPLGLQLIGKPFEEETLFRTAHVIEQAAGKPAQKVYKPMQPGDMIETMADTQRGHEAFGFAPRTPIELGLSWRLDSSRSWVGKEAVDARRATSARRLTCVVSAAEIGAGDAVFLGDRAIGEIVRADRSPLRGEWIASALLDREWAHGGIDRYEVRGARVKTMAPPLVDNRSLYVDPRRHSWRTADEVVVPAARAAARGQS